MNSEDRISDGDLHIVPSLGSVLQHSGNSIGLGNKNNTSLYGMNSWPSPVTDGCLLTNSHDRSTHSDLNNSNEADIDELDDMLCRFDTFFREKLNTELQSHQEFMHGLLSEQQIHLRQILRFNLNVLPSYETGQQVNNRNQEDMTKNYVDLEEAEMPYSYDPGATSSDIHVHRKQGLLTELLSLSCQVSALLSEVRFS
ncbi:uncharacterized protein LOC112565984 isoform X2 [Pomacea canaliculata]|uniref:uncharacterized protein LOC112565984 isoform X2 n=1 Tax=Pomacea canaliculata TaxID=400727 RepID=UPI000D72B5DD|nr:uncharacterized protein LOC112565984 isoform X2 [Pomacea canaliculata]